MHRRGLRGHFAHLARRRQVQSRGVEHMSKWANVCVYTRDGSRPLAPAWLRPPACLQSLERRPRAAYTTVCKHGNTRLFHNLARGTDKTSAVFSPSASSNAFPLPTIPRARARSLSVAQKHDPPIIRLRSAFLPRTLSRYLFSACSCEVTTRDMENDQPTISSCVVGRASEQTVGGGEAVVFLPYHAAHPEVLCTSSRLVSSVGLTSKGYSAHVSSPAEKLLRHELQVASPTQACVEKKKRSVFGRIR